MKKPKNAGINPWILTAILFGGIILMSTFNVAADELVHEFKNPSFSGIGSSAHYLTVENQEKSRRDALKKDIEAALKQAQRDEENTTLAKFMRNLESRIYAQLSKQLVEELFKTCSVEAVAAGTCSETTFGSFVLEGNTITYQKTICDSNQWACTQGDEVIVMTIVAEDGTETQIVIPIGAGTAGGG